MPAIKTLQGRSNKMVMKPKLSKKPAKKDVEVDLDYENSFGVAIEDTMATFVPVVGLFGAEGDPTRLLKEEMTDGILINCVGQTWYVESEPTSPSTAGFIVYAPQARKKEWRSRKPILTGQWVVTAKGDGSYDVDFLARTIYDNVSASPRGDSVSATGTVGTGPNGTTGSISVTYTIKL